MNDMTNEMSQAFMNVRQLADYLHLNEKKVYAMAAEGAIPATKLTGKWLFPKSLVDRWLLESCHSGIMTDRLLLSGSDDPLLQAASNRLTQKLRTQALFSYTVTGTKLGLDLLAQGHADACAIHWGRAEESDVRHPALLQQYSQSKHWILVHLFCRSQGLIVRSGCLERLNDPAEALSFSTRWVVRQDGAGSQRFLNEWLAGQAFPIDNLTVTNTAFSEREVASLIAKGEADIGPGTLSAAKEFGLGFIPVCNESFDLVVPRNVYFRRLLQQLFEFFQSDEGIDLAHRLQGYDLSRCGRLVWSSDPG
ncbi:MULTISPECIES: helix-turn-helix transcriptional regulator [unclassified Neptuniibacter]|uniref:helix-turn-helix transcriptional regulator n=1 Tax=unclassified Neptuniibacter TaxID=2630693 RepID=UPI0025CF8EDA|nr:MULTISPECIES: helix-turn-helix transcriptional regulator [unclassified Neptuniibacter]|tara:strand:- start:49063 stop:49983 length:921 start_codon:yes stop_codon:yes gene_type:complete